MLTTIIHIFITKYSKRKCYKALKRLENKGLVEINPNPKNKSKNYVRITEKGKKVTREFNNQINVIENKIFENYTYEEILQLKKTLRDLSEKYYNLS
jgi:DNA-binding MarR family transcriptional regulator